MPDLNISKKTIYNIFAGNKVNFLIPDYQRPYSWGVEECDTLWTDLYNFTFPDGNADNFTDDKDEYFLGTILTVSNGSSQDEVIDGQQRLITLLLLLRAFYEKFGNTQSKVCDKVSECVWYLDKDDNPDKTRVKIISEVATEADNAELKAILETGKANEKSKSHYAQNYCYFQNKIDEFKNDTPDNFSYFPKRIMQNCIMLPIETNSQNTALRIFTTLNDRGTPLSDSDIFKAQFYKFYSSPEQGGQISKNNFIKRWKNLETICNANFHPRTGTPLDDLFMRYMYYKLAESGTKSDTFIGLRPYFEKDNYKEFKNEKSFEDLETLANFWNDVSKRNEERFSERVLKRLYVLSYSPYNIWSYIVSIYFMGNRDAENNLDEEKFYNFLHKITAMFLMHSIVNPGNQNIRRPFFVEFTNIFKGNELTFKAEPNAKQNYDYRQDRKLFRGKLNGTTFSNTKKITKAMLAWWTFQNENQELPPLDTKLEIEHIYAKKLHETKPLENVENLELLGNKSLLEKRINIYAANLPFANKKIYYLGATNKKNAMPTFNLELLKLAETHEDFSENDILARNEKIFDGFINYLEENKLLK